MIKPSSIPIDQWSGSDATNALHETIKAFNATADKQTRTIIRLTWAILALTGVLVAGLVVQIWIAID